jgi:hypothetical protein
VQAEDNGKKKGVFLALLRRSLSCPSRASDKVLIQYLFLPFFMGNSRLLVENPVIFMKSLTFS